jgi:hypothetical protein
MKFHRRIIDAKIAIDVEDGTEAILSASLILDSQNPTFYPFFTKWKGVSFGFVNQFFTHILRLTQGR